MITTWFLAIPDFCAFADCKDRKSRNAGFSTLRTRCRAHLKDIQLIRKRRCKSMSFIRPVAWVCRTNSSIDRHVPVLKNRIISCRFSLSPNCMSLTFGLFQHIARKSTIRSDGVNDSPGLNEIVLVLVEASMLKTISKKSYQRKSTVVFHLESGFINMPIRIKAAVEEKKP